MWLMNLAVVSGHVHMGKSCFVGDCKNMQSLAKEYGDGHLVILVYSTFAHVSFKDAWKDTAACQNTDTDTSLQHGLFSTGVTPMTHSTRVSYLHLWLSPWIL